MLIRNTLTIILLAVFIPTSIGQDKKLDLSIELNPRINHVYHPYPDVYNFDATFGFATNIALQYELAERSSITFGLGYDYLKTSNEDFSLIFGSDIDPITGVRRNRSYLADKASFHYLNIPLRININTGKDKRSSLSLGVAYQIYLSSNRNGVFHSQTDPSIDGVKMQEYRTETPVNQTKLQLIYSTSIALPRLKTGIKVDIPLNEMFERDIFLGIDNKEWHAYGIGLFLSYPLTSP